MPPTRPRPPSFLRRSAPERVAVALVGVVALWATVFWAIAA